MASPCSVDENEGALSFRVALMVDVEYLFASDVGVGHVSLLRSHFCSRRICGTVAPQAIHPRTAGLQIQREQL
jgi:hypothetical protein